MLSIVFNVAQGNTHSFLHYCELHLSWSISRMLSSHHPRAYVARHIHFNEIPYFLVSLCSSVRIINTANLASRENPTATK